MKLYTYFRSSAAYRVRLALAVKGLTPEAIPVHLLRDGGEQKRPAYRAVNPQGMVPALETDDGAILTQSLAIIEYLEETHPAPALLPADPVARARVRAAAMAIVCDTHPLGNLRVTTYLRQALAADDAAVAAWSRHWIEVGLTAVEGLVAPHVGTFCFGDTLSLADIILMPQMYNARRFGCDHSAFPTLVAIDQRLRALPLLQGAAPERQADAA